MTDPALSEFVERGLEAHRAGRMADAVAAYRSALALKPDDAEVLSLMGLALSQSGRPDEALLLLGRAADSEPSAVGLRLNLAEGLASARQWRRALQEFQTVTSLQPNNVRAWDRVGDIALQLGDEAAAVDGWGRAWLVDYRSVESALKIVRYEIGRERFDVALSVLDSVLSHVPGEPQTLALKCSLLERRRDWPALLQQAVEWSRAHPAEVDAWRMIARAAYELGRHADAVGAFRRVIGLATLTAEEWSTYAGLCLHAGDFNAAAEALDKSEALDARSAGMFAQRALLSLYQGQFAQAEEYCRRCLALDPAHVSTYTTLSRLRSGRLTDAELQSITVLSQRADLEFERRIPAAFVVAQAHDARKEVDAAFRAYTYAHDIACNRDRAEGRAYDRAAREAQERHIVELSRRLLPTPVATSGAMRPIFIVGMPRSGATLIESVLSAHSRVFAMGERLAMPQILHAALDLEAQGAPLDADSMTLWSRAYLAGCAIAEGRDHFTDRQPLNLDAVGLVAALFPEAIVIHLQRDPLETGLLAFSQEANRQWSFVHRLEDIGHYHASCARLAHHWQTLQPERFVTLQYESFVADFESQAQQLVRRCGLDWEPQCLDSPGIARTIAAFGSAMTREATRSSRAARYAAYLQPLASELERSGVNLRTGALDGP